jgi:hypothetical protein
VPLASEKPNPETDAPETVTALAPDELNVTSCVLDDPVFTVPNDNALVLTVSCGLAAAVPVPVKATIAVAPLVELLLKVNEPVSVATVAGAN